MRVGCESAEGFEVGDCRASRVPFTMTVWRVGNRRWDVRVQDCGGLADGNLHITCEKKLIEKKR